MKLTVLITVVTALVCITILGLACDRETLEQLRKLVQEVGKVVESAAG